MFSLNPLKSSDPPATVWVKVIHVAPPDWVTVTLVTVMFVLRINWLDVLANKRNGKTVMIAGPCVMFCEVTTSLPIICGFVALAAECPNDIQLGNVASHTPNVTVDRSLAILQCSVTLFCSWFDMSDVIGPGVMQSNPAIVDA